VRERRRVGTNPRGAVISRDRRVRRALVVRLPRREAEARERIRVHAANALGDLHDILGGRDAANAGAETLAWGRVLGAGSDAPTLNRED
jgi:hypothetical protein